MELEIAYRLAAKRLRSVGETNVAQRFEHRAAELAGSVGSLLGPRMAAALRYAVDAGGARIAARLDPPSACLWEAIAEDQRALARSRLGRGP